MTVGLPGLFALVVVIAVAIFILGLPIVLLVRLARRNNSNGE